MVDRVDYYRLIDLLIVVGVVIANLPMSSATTKCLACTERQEFKEFTKQRIKTEILRKLGLSAAPNVTLRDIPTSGLIRNLIHKMETAPGDGMMADQPTSFIDEDDLFQAKQITIIPSEPTSEMVRSRRHWNTLYYKMSGRIEEQQESLIAANLFLHLPHAPSASHSHARVQVYYIGMDKLTGKPSKLRAKEGTWELRRDRGGFVKIDLVNLVRKWLRKPRENLGIVVEAETNQHLQLDVPSMDSSMAPYMQLHFGRSDTHYRSKREADLKCAEELDAKVTQCCLWPLTIDFSEYGWDWVLYPRTYEANFCNGDCSLGVVPESTHTHLMQMNLQSVARPCCSARRLTEISMLYFDEENNVVMGTLPGMKVEKCGCT